MDFNEIYRGCMVISSLFEIYLVMDFYQAFHEYRERFASPFRRFLLYLVFVCGNIAINFQNNSFLNVILIPFLYLLLLIILFRGTPGKYFLDWLLADFVMFSSEFMFLVLLQIPMNVPTNQLFADSFTMLSSIFAVKLVSFILFMIIKQMSRYSSERFAGRVFGYYIVVPVATLGIMWVIPYIRQTNSEIARGDIILVCFYILMLVGNIRLFYMFVQYNYMKKQELEKEVTLAKYREKERHYKEMKQIEKRHAVLVHNIQHYLKQIGRYAEQGENNDILDTLQELHVEFLENKNETICSNNLLNSILLEWKERVQSQGTRVGIFVESGFNIEFMRGIDIMAVFGNMLDNAAEASAICEEGSVEVKLFMQNDGAFSVVCIRNSYIGEIKRKGKEFISTKQEEGLHGIGIKNTREIVEKYGGYMQNQYSSHEYETTILLPVRKNMI